MIEPPYFSFSPFGSWPFQSSHFRASSFVEQTPNDPRKSLFLELHKNVIFAATTLSLHSQLAPPSLKTFTRHEMHYSTPSAWAIENHKKACQLQVPHARGCGFSYVTRAHYNRERGPIRGGRGGEEAMCTLSGRKTATRVFSSAAENSSSTSGFFGAFMWPSMAFTGRHLASM